MKRLFLLMLIGFIANSCRKEELGSDHPLVGKWQAKSFEFESKCSGMMSAGMSVKQIIKPAIMEIFDSGVIQVTFDGETEKLKILTMQYAESIKVFKGFGKVDESYVCKVKNKKGQKFTFRFYFKSGTTEIVGTYWTPDHPYQSLDQPNYAHMSCSYGAEHLDYSGEFFARYAKL